MLVLAPCAYAVKGKRRRGGTLDVRSRPRVISIPPKYAVAQVVGFIKGKSAIHIARTFMERKRNFVGQNFWVPGYFVSTVGRDEETIRRYIRDQELEDNRVDQLNLV